MLRTLDPSMLGLSQPIRELAPWAARYGFQAVSAPQEVLRDKNAAREAAAVMADCGLSWGLMPMPADFIIGSWTPPPLKRPWRPSAVMPAPPGCWA